MANPRLTTIQPARMLHDGGKSIELAATSANMRRRRTQPRCLTPRLICTHWEHRTDLAPQLEWGSQTDCHPVLSGSGLNWTSPEQTIVHPKNPLCKTQGCGVATAHRFTNLPSCWCCERCLETRPRSIHLPGVQPLHQFFHCVDHEILPHPRLLLLTLLHACGVNIG